jgi:hypothetical protein
MKKRLLIALSVIGIAILAFVLFFYAATATKKQRPVEVSAPPTSVK